MNFPLHLVIDLLRNDWRVMILYEILRKLSGVSGKFVSEEIGDVVFLHQEVTAIEFIFEDAGYSRLIPSILPCGSLYVVSCEMSSYGTRAIPFQIFSIDETDYLCF